jgi:tripartite-type tricarboxylate transporter receptor subunit TctC
MTTPPTTGDTMKALTRRLCLQLAGAALASASGVAAAQGYPSKTIQIVVPFPPGGPNDIVARLVGEQLAAAFKQTVIVENRSGATGNIGAQAVARAQPDGHTLLLTLDTSITANPTLYGKRMGFDVDRDLRPVSIVAGFGQMLVARPQAGYAGFKGFAEASRKGGSYASAGTASPGHLTMELLQSFSRGEMVHVPYRGNAPALNDILGGQVEAGFVAAPTALQHVGAGKLVALAMSGPKRSVLAPDVPTIAEQGFPGATTQFSFVLLAPAATPDDVVKRLSAEVRRAVTLPAVRQKLEALDVDPIGSTPDEAAAQLKGGTQKWAQLIKARNIKPD